MKRDIEFLFEIAHLRHIRRAWVQHFGPNIENVAEHMFRVAWLAMLISKMEKQGDHEKIIKMALFHDMSEGRTGDVDYLSRQYTERHEKLAVDDMLKGTSFQDFQEIFEEYEKRESIESKIVKDADTLTVDMELTEQAYMGNKLKENFQAHRQKILNNGIYTESAKKLWKEITEANPHDWHLNGRNRINQGDWKDYK